MQEQASHQMSPKPQSAKSNQIIYNYPRVKGWHRPCVVNGWMVLQQTRICRRCLLHGKLRQALLDAEQRPRDSRRVDTMDSGGNKRIGPNREGCGGMEMGLVFGIRI